MLFRAKMRYIPPLKRLIIVMLLSLASSVGDLIANARFLSNKRNIAEFNLLIQAQFGAANSHIWYYKVLAFAKIFCFRLEFHLFLAETNLSPTLSMFLFVLIGSFVPITKFTDLSLNSSDRD